MRVMGIDPGISTTGYGVVEKAGGGLRGLTMGAVRTPAGAAHANRLAILYGELARLLAEQRPEAVAIERLFFNSNVKTAMAVGQASGVALLAAAHAGVRVTHYTPLEVKQAVVGVGSAPKTQVQAMVVALLRLSEPPASLDAADALALAICHINRSPLKRALERAKG
jgi:crossover junction endodeoxyribonuclease RuvC